MMIPNGSSSYCLPFASILSRHLHLSHRHSVSQLASGCVTCHTCHGCVTDFRPILGNPVEVAHMTSPGTVYISHAKGTYFPLARIYYDTPVKPSSVRV